MLFSSSKLWKYYHLSNLSIFQVWGLLGCKCCFSTVSVALGWLGTDLLCFKFMLLHALGSQVLAAALHILTLFYQEKHVCPWRERPLPCFLLLLLHPFSPSSLLVVFTLLLFLLLFLLPLYPPLLFTLNCFHILPLDPPHSDSLLFLFPLNNALNSFQNIFSLFHVLSCILIFPFSLLSFHFPLFLHFPSLNLQPQGGRIANQGLAKPVWFVAKSLLSMTHPHKVTKVETRYKRHASRTPNQNPQFFRDQAQDKRLEEQNQGNAISTKLILTIPKILTGDWGFPILGCETKTKLTTSGPTPFLSWKKHSGHHLPFLATKKNGKRTFQTGGGNQKIETPHSDDSLSLAILRFQSKVSILTYFGSAV